MKHVECRCLALLFSVIYSIDCIDMWGPMYRPYRLYNSIASGCRYLHIAWPRTSSGVFSGQKEADDVHRGHLLSFAPFCHVGASGDTSEVLLFFLFYSYFIYIYLSLPIFIYLYLFRIILVSSGILIQYLGLDFQSLWRESAGNAFRVAHKCKTDHGKQSTTKLKHCQVMFGDSDKCLHVGRGWIDLSIFRLVGKLRWKTKHKTRNIVPQVIMLLRPS